MFNVTVNGARFYIDEAASYPDVSLFFDENVRATVCIPFPWSLAVHHQSLVFRALLYDEKNEAPEEEAVDEQFDLHATRRISISANRVHHFYLRDLNQT